MSADKIEIFKARVAESFSNSAKYYDDYAIAQHKSAHLLAGHVAELISDLPDGPVFEAGCGTGRLSEALASLMPCREIFFSDISAGMINKCRDSLQAAGYTSSKLKWIMADAEKINAESKYSLIVSALTLQWFENVGLAMENFSRALVSDGYLLCSYLGSESFPEWRKICSSFGIPCTANRLLDHQYLQSVAQEHFKYVKSWEDVLPVSYNSSRDFFNSLKKTGTSTVDSGQSISLGQMKKLISCWDRNCNGGPVKVTYHIHTILGKMG